MKEKLSPMMTHYFTIKEKYADTIVMYRLGDFYEMFFDDAKKASDILDLTLTGRDCGLKERAPMCGVPYHAVDNYIAKLIEHGEKVAICEQLTLPEESKGMVERDVVRVITPGTVVEDNILDEKKNNYLLAIAASDKEVGIAWADISTGEFNTIEFDADNVREIEDMLITIGPAEMIGNYVAIDNFNSFDSIKLGKLPKIAKYFDWAFDYDTDKKRVLKCLKVDDLTAFELQDKKMCITACGACLHYLDDTQKRSLDHINNIKFIANNSFMFLDTNTRRNLELTETNRDKKKKGSLLWVLDKTETNMGARNLRKWLDQPLRDEKSINNRLDAVSEIVADSRLRADITATLDHVNDIERIAGKIAYGTIMPREIVALRESLKVMPEVKLCIKGQKTHNIKAIYNNIGDFTNLVKLLDASIKDEPPTTLKDGGYIKEGFSEELDEYRDIITNSNKWIPEMELKEKEEHGLKIRIGYNKVFGYYIEVPKGQVDKVPINYIRKQTLANAERYITPELKELEDKILGAEEKAKKLEAKIYDFVKGELSNALSSIKTTANSVAELDTYNSFAIIAVDNRYIKPTINKKVDKLEIIEGRHPVVERLLKDNEYVSNDTYLDTGKNRTMVITGPNMAGKSTYMRQVALITLMAHLGSFVPATIANIPLTDRIFTRVGASDDVAYGQSTFMVEMIEVATILRNATKNSLLILDEIGRGTSTYDGLSIAWAVIEYISKKVMAKTLFSTHYHELTELEGKVEGVRNYRITVKEINDTIIFLHKIVRGGTNKSFGIEVASLAGVPEEVTDRAKEIAKQLEEINLDKDTNGIVLAATELSRDNTMQMSFLENSIADEILDSIRHLNLNKMTPMDALMKLHELQEKVK